MLERMQRTIDILDAAGLALFSVTGASIALAYHLGPPEAVLLGAISGIGGGILRDMIVREVPQGLRSGLYAIPALAGAAIIVIAQRSGGRGALFPVLAAAARFAIRLAGIVYDISLPPPRGSWERGETGAVAPGRGARPDAVAPGRWRRPDAVAPGRWRSAADSGPGKPRTTMPQLPEGCGEPPGQSLIDRAARPRRVAPCPPSAAGHVP